MAAQLAKGEVPAHVPVELTTRMFDDMADTYDKHMVRDLGYRLPKLAADQLLEIFPDRRFNLLDLGCGTGQLSALVASFELELSDAEVETLSAATAPVAA